MLIFQLPKPLPCSRWWPTIPVPESRVANWVAFLFGGLIFLSQGLDDQLLLMWLSCKIIWVEVVLGQSISIFLMCTKVLTSEGLLSVFVRSYNCVGIELICFLSIFNMQKVSNPIILHVDANLLTPTPSLTSLPAHDYQPVSVRAIFLVNQC